MGCGGTEKEFNDCIATQAPSGGCLPPDQVRGEFPEICGDGDAIVEGGKYEAGTCCYHVDMCCVDNKCTMQD